MKIVKDLLLALLNATLLLVALCLFLFWQLSESARSIAGEFASNLSIVQPIGEDLKGLRTDLQTMREDVVEAINTQSGSDGSSVQKLEIRLASLDQRLQGIQSAMDKLADTPDRLMAEAVTLSTSRLAGTAYRLRGCSRPDAPVTPDMPAS